MLMHYKKVCSIVFLFGLFPFTNYGQTKLQDPVNPFFLSGPKGTVIQFIFSDDYINGLMFNPTEKVMVYKNPTKGKKRTLIKEVSFPSSANELSARLGIENIQSLMENLKCNSVEALYHKIQTQPVDSLGLNLFSLELQMALGLAYIDETWKVGEVAHYEIEKVNASGEVLHRMSHTLSGKAMHYPYKFRLSEEEMTDSLARFTWSTPEVVKFRGAFPVFSKLMRKSDLQAEYQEVGQGVVVTPIAGDSSHVYYRQAVQPGQAYSFYSVLYDWAGNESKPSDTTYALSVSPHEIELITEFRASPQKEGIALTWKPLKKSALYTGIEISKSRVRDSGYVVLDTVSGQESSFVDNKILQGSAYYYRIRPLLLIKNPSMVSEYSEASATIQYNEDHPAPLKPDGLRLTTHPEGIQLSWWKPNEVDIFGYYVLRGINSMQMERIGEIVRDTVFVDKEFPLDFSGDLNYALIAMNQNQQLSDTSEIVAFGIRQQTTLMPPAGLAIYEYENSLTMRWNDVKAVDHRVSNYLLLRRKKGEEKFDLVKSSKKIDVPFYSHPIADEDSGLAYEYAVVSQDIWGNISASSNPVLVNSSRALKVLPPSEVLLRNLNNGIEVSWPLAYSVGEETYVIYRREDGISDFKEIARVQPGEVDYYLDSSVKNDQLYEYSISILNKNIEGDKSAPSTIRR